MQEAVLHVAADDVERWSETLKPASNGMIIAADPSMGRVEALLKTRSHPRDRLSTHPMVDEKQGGQMLNRVRSLRRHAATELGFIVPSVHITDNLRLCPREYVVLLRGTDRPLADRSQLHARRQCRS